MISLTLRDVVARGTPIEWFEAVAIVQELAAAVAAGVGPDGLRVPDLEGAALAEDGSVNAIDPGSGDQAPVFRLAHVLNALLTNASPPVQLRLLVLTGLAPEATYKTLREFSQALEYFERPDRRLVVKAVLERAQKLPPVESKLPPLPERPEAPKAETKRKERNGRTLSRRERVLLAAAIPSTLLLAAGGWWLTRPAGARVLSDTKTLVAKAVSATVETIRGVTGQPATSPSVEAQAPAAAREPAAPVGRHAPPPIKPDRSLARNGLAPIVKDAPKGDAPARTSVPLRVDEVIWLDPPPPDQAAPTVVYSASDADVRPPVAIWPKLPTDPPAGIPIESLTRLELLVSAEGDVDSVKIVAGPRNTLDGIMTQVRL